MSCITKIEKARREALTPEGNWYCKPHDTSHPLDAFTPWGIKNYICKVAALERNQSDKGRAAQKKYEDSDKGRTRQKKYEDSDKGRIARSKAHKKYNHKLGSGVYAAFYLILGIMFMYIGSTCTLAKRRSDHLVPSRTGSGLPEQRAVMFITLESCDNDLFTLRTRETVYIEAMGLDNPYLLNKTLPVIPKKQEKE